ncbi:MAG TPA: LytTR family DNA-binding domain-containing protein [Acidobacteriota bacterium]|nr:LytTR family DNA-binding domain-containing protein [Acidobacteriota bacterium]
MNKARIKLTTTDHSLARQQQFLQAYQPPVVEYMQRLPVRRQNRILIVPTTSVTSLALDQGLVMVTTLENTQYSTKFTTFSQIKPHLDPAQFLRVHRLFIVNLAHVREVITYDNNTASLVMACGNQVPVSRGHIKELRTALNL